MKLRTGVGGLAAGSILLLSISLARVGAQAPPATSPSTHAVLSGRVIFEGPLPENKWVPVRKHRTFCGEKRPLGAYRVSSSGGVENAVLLLEAEADTPAMPREGRSVIFLDNRECEFLPRVQVARPFAVLEVRNSDPILHSAHAFLEDGKTAFHVALPHFRDRTHTRLPGAGLLRIECDVGHSWMRAYILISSAPFTTVTGGDGTFEIRGIPPGQYRLRTWHEALGEIQREVSVPKGKRLTLTIVFRAGNAIGQ